MSISLFFDSTELNDETTSFIVLSHDDLMTEKCKMISNAFSFQYTFHTQSDLFLNDYAKNTGKYDGIILFGVTNNTNECIIRDILKINNKAKSFIFEEQFPRCNDCQFAPLQQCHFSSNDSFICFFQMIYDLSHRSLQTSTIFIH